MPLPNPGFEEELAGWTVGEKNAPMSTVEAGAARSGKLGLRILDEDAALGSSVESAPLPVTAGQSYRLRFFAKTTAAENGCAVNLWFRDSTGQRIPDPAPVIITPEATDWTEFSGDIVAPADATEVTVWIHSFSRNQGEWMVDDITLEDLSTPDGAPVAAAAPAPKPQPKLPDPLVPVVLKLDDLSTGGGNVPAPWRKLVDLAKERNLKITIGLIAKSLEGDKPNYFKWLKEVQDTGLVELWYHGYDHGVRTVDGKQYAEFSLRTYEEQKERFTMSQDLARKVLGAPFTVYGPPGGGNTPPSDADLEATARVMQEDPDMKYWLYPKALDALGSKVEEAGKVRVLDRVYQVNIEQPLFVPASDKFIAGYSKFAKGRKYYIVQGHPAQWDAKRWEEFIKIIDFLQENKIPVVTATEVAKQLE
jgi:peptidoglycan/xylan/chitin deacetylase (PgdA/CDA1 family)